MACSKKSARQAAPTLLQLEEAFEAGLQRAEDCLVEACRYRLEETDHDTIRDAYHQAKDVYRVLLSTLAKYHQALKAAGHSERSSKAVEQSDVLQSGIVALIKDLTRTRHAHGSVCTEVTGVSYSSSQMEILQRKKREEAVINARTVAEQAALEQQKDLLELEQKRLQRQHEKKKMESEHEALEEQEKLEMKKRELDRKKDIVAANISAEVLNQSMEALAKLDEVDGNGLVAEFLEQSSPEFNPGFLHNCTSNNVAAAPKETVLDTPHLPFQLAATSLGGRSKPDATVQHLIRRELFETSPNPFDGDPARFQTWARTLESKMAGIDLNAFDQITVLEANTSGKALELVKKYSISGGVDPDAALRTIWERMQERFGSSVKIAAKLRQEVESFPIIHGADQGSQLLDLSDLCSQVEAHLRSLPELSDFNHSHGQRAVWLKLPGDLQSQWRKAGTRYEAGHGGEGPPFSVLSKFIHDVAMELSNERYKAPEKLSSTPGSKTRTLFTEVKQNSSDDPCPLHMSGNHQLTACKVFANLSPNERWDKVKEVNLCFKCLKGGHIVRNCTSKLSCTECGKSHHSLIHLERSKESAESEQTATSLCTLARPCVKGRSFGKTVLVDLRWEQAGKKTLTGLAIIDEQSTTSFVDPYVLDFFGIASENYDYTLSTLLKHCAKVQGRKVTGLSVSEAGQDSFYLLPEMLSNDSIPDTREEMATREDVRRLPHLVHLANKFKEVEEKHRMLLLIGRDASKLLHSKCYGQEPPFAFRTPLGWALVGTVCGKDAHTPSLRALRTALAHNHFEARPSIGEQLASPFPTSLEEQVIKSNVFAAFKDDEMPGLSVEDEKFLRLMSSSVLVDREGNPELPLPFKKEPHMPNYEFNI